MRGEPTSPAPSARSAQDTSASPTNKKVSDTDRDDFKINPHLTVFPGYDPAYFEGILPAPEMDPYLFDSVAPINYDWSQLEDLAPTEGQKGKTFKAFDPASMYVNSLPWVAYPYGIPADDQPCPYYRKKEAQLRSGTLAESSSASSSSSSSGTSSSSSSSSPSSLSSASSETVQPHGHATAVQSQQPAVPVPRQKKQHYMWRP